MAEMQIEAARLVAVEATRLTAVEAKPIGAIAVKPIGTTPIEGKPIAAVHIQWLRLRFPFWAIVSRPSPGR
jgi:hypothetical protein